MIETGVVEDTVTLILTAAKKLFADAAVAKTRSIADCTVAAWAESEVRTVKAIRTDAAVTAQLTVCGSTPHWRATAIFMLVLVAEL
jgi:hypothetical protein